MAVHKDTSRRHANNHSEPIGITVRESCPCLTKLARSSRTMPPLLSDSARRMRRSRFMRSRLLTVTQPQANEVARQVRVATCLESRLVKLFQDNGVTQAQE